VKASKLRGHNVSTKGLLVKDGVSIAEVMWRHVVHVNDEL
jgi:hypothetical protein